MELSVIGQQKRMPQSTLMTALGLMSGTSGDGIDAALIRTDGEHRIEFLGAETIPYEACFRDRLLAAAQKDVPLLELLGLENELTELHAHAVVQICAELRLPVTSVNVIGFHGHTVRHAPQQGVTYQLGNISLLAERCHVPVVGDFRRRDIAAGGEGAPLVPLYHAMLLKEAIQPTLILNLGGVANITYLHEDKIIAGDVGPGCGLMDSLAQERLAQACDLDGILAAAGTPDLTWIEIALQQAFFRKPLPKSADRFEFAKFPLSNLATADAMATLCLFTARAATDAIRHLNPLPQVIYVVGGGSHNPTLVSWIEKLLGIPLSIGSKRLRVDSLEAECFAWLAVRRLRLLPLSLPSTTNCRNPCRGGLLAD